MSLVVLGLNHHTTPLDILERVTIPAGRMAKALADLSGRPYIAESVILSTCNRTEVYVDAEKFHGGYQDVRDFLAQFAQIAPEDFADYLYVLYDTEAVNHLFGVAAGLDSAVVGEHEIQGQVKTAWQTAHTEQTVGSTLNAVFRHALEVGKRARTETGIGRHITSVSQAAAVLAAQHLGTLDGKRAFVLGAGDMGMGMTRAVAESGASLAQLVVASRTWKRASGLAEQYSGQAVHLDQIEDELLHADVVFTSTSAASYMIDHEQLAPIIDLRAGRPLLIVDIAMPRDVEPAAGDLPGVTLLDMDAVREFTEAGMRERQAEVARVQTIINAEVSRYFDTATAREMDPIIAAFRGQIEQIRQAELQRFAPSLAGLSTEQSEALDALTKAMLAKVMHEPTTRLKKSADSKQGERLATALRTLFDLDP